MYKQSFNLTPRLKNIFFFLFIKKIIFINKFIKLFSFSFFFFKKFIKYFYNNQVFFVFKKTSFEIISFYENNLFKSSVY